jgi:hypothetical protein
MARTGDAGLIATLWLAALAKVFVGALALAPLRPLADGYRLGR